MPIAPGINALGINQDYEDLRAKRQRNALGDMDVARQPVIQQRQDQLYQQGQQQYQQGQDAGEHKQILAAAQWVRQSQSPKAAVMQNFPQLAQQIPNFQAMSDDDVRELADGYIEHFSAQLGIGANGTPVGQGSPQQQPNSIREYEYARQNGFKGSFQDWTTAGGQSSRPSSVQEWEVYNKLPPDQQQRYLEMKRNPNFMQAEVNQVPTVVHPSVGFGTSATPLSTQASEQQAATSMKQAEGRGSEIGQAEGKIQGGIETRGANAVGTTNLLDLADTLIGQATGSKLGAARDAAAGVFGGSTEGARAIASLKVLQAGLMTAMPRMEGPQSDRDVQLYREASGQIGDPSVPTEIKKAAVQTIRQIQNKYVERAGGTPTNNGPPRISNDSDYSALPSGTQYIAPDGSTRTKR